MKYYTPRLAGLCGMYGLRRTPYSVSTYPAMHNKHEDDFHRPVSILAGYLRRTNRAAEKSPRDALHYVRVRATATVTAAAASTNVVGVQQIHYVNGDSDCGRAPTARRPLRLSRTAHAIYDHVYSRPLILGNVTERYIPIVSYPFKPLSLPLDFSNHFDILDHIGIRIINL